MPKSLFINPKTTLAKSRIDFSSIPVNSYEKPFEQEVSDFGVDNLMKIYNDMRAIREFESGIVAIKNGIPYRNVKKDFKGPAHLSIGQEASAVGQAYCLNKNDICFGTHRAHAEFIARGFNAYRDFDDDELYGIMQNTNGGEILRILERNKKYDGIKDLTEDFVLYGLLSEIFAKKTGFQKGMSGSMHAFFMPFGIYPNNAIVGASAPIASGAGLYKRVNAEKGIVVANIGDGALGCGVVYESMNFSAMDQLEYLWKDKKRLPVIFAISDNGYGMGGQTRGETMAFDMAARLGVGVTPSQMYAERINGNNPLAVIDAYKRKKELVERGECPVLLDVLTYRQEGHSVSDNMSYREKEEITAWKEFDPIDNFAKALCDSKVADNDVIKDVDASVKDKVGRIYELALNDEISPYFSLSEAKELYECNLLNDNKISLNNLEKSVLEAERILPRKSGEPVTMRRALSEAVVTNMLADKKLIVYGEEVRDWGGISGVYKGLSDVFPYERLFNAPISEATIVSSAIGYATCGGKALIEIMFADFLCRAGDEIINQLAKWRSISAGSIDLPIVIRVAVGAKYGSQHSQDLSSMFATIPGLKVVYPSTPYDAKGVLNSALVDNNPILFFENQRLYSKTEIFEKEVPLGYYTLEIGKPKIKIFGDDVTIVTFGNGIYTAKTVSENLKSQGVGCEVIDLLTLSPIDDKIIVDSVNKTGRVVFLSDTSSIGSVLHVVANEITSKCFGKLKYPPVVLGANHTVAPSCEYDDSYFVTAEELQNEILKLF